MKYIIVALLLFSPILYAQEESKEESREELLKKLHKIMDEASKSMEESEKDLARASLPPTRPDVIAERVKSIIQKMKDDKINKDELPESVKEWLKNHPELNDKSVKELADSKNLLEELFEIELKLESKLEESNKAAESVENVGNAIDIINKLRQSNQNQSNDSMKNNQSATKDPKNKSEGTGDAVKPSNDKTETESKPHQDDLDSTQVGRAKDNNSFKAEGKSKEMEAGSSNEEKLELSKYKGFWEKWCEKIRSRR